MIKIIVNIFGLIEEIQKLKLSINLLTQKYRKELTPNIKFQPKKRFDDLLEKVIKSCKATNLEFLKLKEKLGLCLYEDICDEQELILMPEEIFKEEKIITQLLQLCNNCAIKRRKCENRKQKSRNWKRRKQKSRKQTKRKRKN